MARNKALALISCVGLFAICTLCQNTLTSRVKRLHQLWGSGGNSVRLVSKLFVPVSTKRVWNAVHLGMTYARDLTVRHEVMGLVRKDGDSHGMKLQMKLPNLFIGSLLALLVELSRAQDLSRGVIRKEGWQRLSRAEMPASGNSTISWVETARTHARTANFSLDASFWNMQTLFRFETTAGSSTGVRSPGFASKLNLIAAILKFDPSRSPLTTALDAE
ncbi:uncharacterized protein LY89DRAFT_712796 [Mollisia scopiformis]|uniref:Uncharacterized protein n=1 Tax=Mollisia scopiformis TaxID=149040 RepID=A0A194XUT0_MOLSC|nr:uncharacterized protein LY89DRAFT_712796 [Mollisia scopiformis]KUJ23794.1 hypothetical protein LY89DRAFT_712796 [Mollisia scopiformis]